MIVERRPRRSVGLAVFLAVGKLSTLAYAQLLILGAWREHPNGLVNAAAAVGSGNDTRHYSVGVKTNEAVFSGREAGKRALEP